MIASCRVRGAFMRKLYALCSRVSSIYLPLPFPIELVCIFFVTDRHSYERKLHAEFEAKRLNGEWFALNQIDIDHFLKVEVLFSDFQLISILKRFRSEGEFAAAAGVIELWNDLENHVLPLPNEEELEGSVQ